MTDDKLQQAYKEAKIEQYPLFQKKREEANNALKEELEKIDKLLASDNADKDAKGHLKFFRANLIMFNRNKIAILDAVEFAYMLAQMNFNSIKQLTETLAKTNSDVAKLNATLQEPRIAEMTRILEDIENRIKEGNKASTDASADYCV